MIAEKIEHETIPKKYRQEGAKKSDFADLKRMKYPLHTEANARSALQYFSKPKNRGGYSSAEVKSIAKRIIAACKKYGIEVSDDSYETFGLKPPVKKSRTMRGVQDGTGPYKDSYESTVGGKGKRLGNCPKREEYATDEQYRSALKKWRQRMKDKDTMKSILNILDGGYETMTLQKALDIRLFKAKYIKRWKGKDGKWKYLYRKEVEKKTGMPVEARKDISKMKLQTKDILTWTKKFLKNSPEMKKLTEKWTSAYNIPNRDIVDLFWKKYQSMSGSERRQVKNQLAGAGKKQVKGKVATDAQAQAYADKISGWAEDNETFPISKETNNVWVSDDPAELGWFSPSKKDLIDTIVKLTIKGAGGRGDPKEIKQSIEDEVFKDGPMWRYQETM